MPANNPYEDAEKLSKFVENPEKYLNESKSKVVNFVETIKKEIANHMPQPIKPYFQGDIGDIVLFIIFTIMVILTLKILGLVLRILIKITILLSTIALIYFVYKHFFS